MCIGVGLSTDQLLAVPYTFNVVFSMFVCYSAAFCQLCFYNKDWIGLDWNRLSCSARRLPLQRNPPNDTVLGRC